MPLVIAVIIIVALLIIFNDRQKESDRWRANYAKSRRKTNAYLERKVLDNYMKSGMNFNEAYKATLYKMPELGFEPCIPKEAYGTKNGVKIIFDNEETSYIDDPGKYDSSEVRDRREELKKQGICVEEVDYSYFPTNDYEYLKGIQQRTLLIGAFEIGDCIIYPRFGTCEVIDRKIIGGNGSYTIRSLKNGKSMTINMKDPKIRKMSSNIRD